MEAQKKKVLKLQKKKSENRSPLQNLNTLHFHKSTTRNTSNLSSSSSVEARNGGLRFLRSSNSSSHTSLPPSSSRKPKSLPKVAANVSAKSVRSKENELPKKKQQLGIHRWQDGEPKTNPMFKTAERSKLSSGRGNPVKISEGNKLNPDCTPVWSSGVRRNAEDDSGSRKANGGSAASAKTPPVEVSLSPEIQSKVVVSKSAATPVCYGAGHLLSGVTDKRKCRRRGSLRGDCEKVNLFYDEKSDLLDCVVPLPGEASVRWLLSPCDEGREEQGTDSDMKVEECEVSCGDASLKLDLLSSASMLCGNASELASDDSEVRGSGSLDGVVKGKKAMAFMLSPQENLESHCFLGNLDKKLSDYFSDATPNSVSNCVFSVGLGEGKAVNENNSAVSLGSLSSGNIIQTPDSDLSLYEASHRNSVTFELDSIKETLDAASMSSSPSVAPIQVQKNVDSVYSWASSFTSENLTLSQMRISWRDGLESCVHEDDELDCWPCVSDEEIDGVGWSEQQLKPHQPCQSGSREDEFIKTLSKPHDHRLVRVIEDGDRWRDNDRRNACAESICTNRSDLGVSCDSDWTTMEGSNTFQVK